MTMVIDVLNEALEIIQLYVLSRTDDKMTLEDFLSLGLIKLDN